MRPEPDESLYFIGIGLPTKESAFFEQLIVKLSGQSTSPPHVTLIPPFFHPNQSYLIEKLTATARTLSAFDVTFDKVGSFMHKKNSTVFLAPDSTFALKRMQRTVEEAFPFLPHELDYTPHLSLARRIAHDDVLAVKKQIRDWGLKLELEVEKLTLYQKHKSQSWEVCSTMMFGQHDEMYGQKVT